MEGTSCRGAVHVFGLILIIGALGATVFIARTIEGRLDQADLQLQILRQQIAIVDSRVKALEAGGVTMGDKIGK